MFAAHGSFELDISGNIIISHIKGAWNRETAIDFETQMKKAIRELKGVPFGMVSVFDEWELYTPDCKPIVSELFFHALQCGLQKEGLVNSHDSVKMRHFALLISSYPDFERKLFTSTEQALEWLATYEFVS